MRELVALQSISEASSDTIGTACSTDDSNICWMCSEICTNVDDSLSHKLFGTLHASEGFGGGMGQFVPFAMLSPAKRLRTNCTDEVCIARCV